MKRVLIELYFEELDVNIHEHIKNKYDQILNKFFDLNAIESGIITKAMITPQRIILNVEFDDEIIYFEKGIKIDSSEENIQYFLKKFNLSSVNDLEVVDNNYYYKEKVNSKTVYENFIKNIENILKDVFVSINTKSNNLNKILLNLKNILCIDEEKILKISFNNIQSNNFTFVNNEKFLIKNYDEFFNILKTNNIFLNSIERKDFITKTINSFSFERYISNNKNKFIENIYSIAEKPLFLVAKRKFGADDLFLNILQKYLKDKYLFFIKDSFLYFVVLDKRGKADLSDINLDEFCDSNLESTKKYELVVEKAIFKLNNTIEKYDLENKKCLKDHKLIFNESKLSRLEKLTKFIAIWVPYSNIDNVDEVLSSYVFSSSNLLNKNKELDLLIRKYVLLKENKDEEFVETIIDSFKPFDKNGDLPKIPLAIAISIANKIDNIIFLSINKEIRDNFDKREENKLYYDLIRIIIHYGLNLPLKMVFHYTFKNFINSTIKIKKDKKIIKEYNVNADNIINRILSIIYDKFYYFISAKDNIDPSLLSSLFLIENAKLADPKNKCVISRIYKTINGINLYFKNDKSQDLLVAYKRINNLLIKHKKYQKLLKKNKKFIIRKKSFKNQEEDKLHLTYLELEKSIKTKLKTRDYYDALELLQEIVNPLNDFLNKVYIAKSNFIARKRYIMLLVNVRNLFNTVIDFSKLS